MWKAPEPRDDVVVTPRVIAAPGHSRIPCQRLEQGDALLLVGEVLAVLEGEIEELAPYRGQRAVEAMRQRGAGGVAGHRVGREGLGPAAIEIARQLVEKQDQREAGLGLLGPIGTAAARRPLLKRLKPRAQRRVEIGIDLEPDLARLEAFGRIGP